MSTKTTVDWLRHISRIIKEGDWVGNTKELINLTFEYDTQYPVINATNRGINYGFMAAEASYILQGRNDIGYLKNILPQFSKYSETGYYQPGAYGPQVVDQLEYVILNLLENKLSRQAVLSIWRPSPRKSPDTPCTLTMQFLVRDNKMDTVVNMRSSDAYMGLIYDTFCFAMISSAVCSFLDDVELGRTYINAGSSHIYRSVLNHAAKLCVDPGTIEGGNKWLPTIPHDLIEVLEVIAKSDKPKGMLLYGKT